MNRTVLQVPIDAPLRLAAEKEAREIGFSSLQEAVRIFLKKMASKSLTFSLGQNEERLSPRAERRYLEMVNNIKTDKVKTVKFENVDAMMEYLDK